MPPQSRSRYGTSRPDIELLRMALLEQEGNGLAGRQPSSMAMNAYLGEMPETFEQEREGDLLSEMDRRYYQSREDDRKRRGAVDDAKALASVREFQTRTGTAEDTPLLADSPDPSAVRTIRRFGNNRTFTDPDAARSARQVALDDPRVLAVTEKPIIPTAAQTKAAEDRKRADAKTAETRAEVVRLATEIRDSPVLARNVGPLDSRLKTILPDSVAWEGKVQRLRDLLAMEARTKLQGQGAVSDFESRMLANSTNALRTGSDEESFKTELDRIIEEQGGTRRAPRKVGRFTID